MPSSPLSPHLILLAFWLAMLFLAAFFLRMACGICGMELPSWRRCLASVLVVTFLAYVAFDFTAYLVLRSLNGVALLLPPGYGYHLWFREPIGLKLAVVGLGGPLRYIPYIFGLCAAGVLQVIVLQAQVTFRMGLVIFALQWAPTLVAGYLLSLLLGVGLSAVGGTPQPPVSAPPDQEQARARGRQADTGRPSIQRIEHEVQDAVKGSQEYFTHAAENLKEYAQSHLEEVKEDLAPLVKRLPQPVQDFLDRGGWWAVFAVLAVIVLVWLRAILRRLAGAFTRRRRKKKRPRSKKVAVNLKERLKDIGEAYTEEGPHQITVKGLPARLRLVVLSLGTRNAGELSPEMVDRVLDRIKPGLAEVVSGDYPRVRVWPLFYSFSGFATAFANNVPIPEPRGEPTHWVLVTGQVRMGKAILHVGLALYADEETTLRNLTVKGEQWLDVLGVKDTRQPAGAR